VDRATQADSLPSLRPSESYVSSESFERPILVLGKGDVATTGPLGPDERLRIRVPLPAPARGGELAACYLLAVGEFTDDDGPALTRRLVAGERWLDLDRPGLAPGAYRAILVLDGTRVSELDFRIGED
jgi:hypothetical protein